MTDPVADRLGQIVAFEMNNLRALRRLEAPVSQRLKQWWKVQQLRQQLRWSALRRAGRRRHILLRGVLAWGLPMFAITFILDFPFDDRSLGIVLPVRLTIWALGGYAFGLWTWTGSERSYSRFVESLQ